MQLTQVLEFQDAKSGSSRSLKHTNFREFLKPDVECCHAVV